MFNKKLFESICNLTCENENFNFNPANRRKVKYDLEDPFIKYYSYDSIVKAFNKHINKEWTSSDGVLHFRFSGFGSRVRFEKRDCGRRFPVWRYDLPSALPSASVRVRYAPDCIAGKMER